MNIIEAMKERRSVRSFDGEPLSHAKMDQLVKAVEESASPFGGSVTIRLREYDYKAGFKPSTYGMIRGAVDFFLLGIGSDDQSALTAGFRFEQVVLKAWQLGLGTCWITATFKGTDFDTERWPDGEKLRIVCPVGVPVGKSLMEKITRFVVRSDNRKPFDSMFFYGDFSGKVPADNRFREALEMMRLAPSSTNSQPWRALVIGDMVHFYCNPVSKASVLDCGIGICHFYETEKFHGRDGMFGHLDDAPVSPSGWKYLATYQSAK